MSATFVGFDCSARFNIISMVLPVCSHNGKTNSSHTQTTKGDGWRICKKMEGEMNGAGEASTSIVGWRLIRGAEVAGVVTKLKKKNSSASCGFFKLPKGLEDQQMFFHAVEAGDMAFSGCLSVSQILWTQHLRGADGIRKPSPSPFFFFSPLPYRMCNCQRTELPLQPRIGWPLAYWFWMSSNSQGNTKRIKKKKNGPGKNKKTAKVSHQNKPAAYLYPHPGLKTVIVMWLETVTKWL